MRWWLAALISCALAGESDVRVVRGPWQWRAADGAPRLACLVAGTGHPTGVLTVAGVPAPGSEAVHAQGQESVLVTRLPAGTAGPYRWRVAGAVLDGVLPPLPPADAPVRVLVAGPGAWPSADQVAAFAARLGGPIDAALVLGDGAERVLGSGGWEAALPVLVVAADVPALAAVSDGEAARWRFGGRIGCLGLPASPDRGRADLAIARDLSPWLVYCDVPAAWDPALSRPAPGDLQDLAVLVSACVRMQVPLVLGAGRAGLVGEPLAPAGPGRIAPAAGGTRYVCPVPALEDGLFQVEEALALPLEAPLLAGLSADPQRLELVLGRPGEAAALRLRWLAGDAASPGAGAGAAAPLLERLAKAEDLAAAAAHEDLDRLWLLPRAALAAAPHPDAAMLGRLRDEGGAAGRALVRRLLLIRADEPAAARPDGDPDPLAERDRLLWRIARVRGRDAAGWSAEAAATQDQLVLRALLRDVARDPERELLPVLVQRVRLQAEGTQPPDADPLIQHKLYSAVFDSPYLSPTPLRAMALALRPRVSELGRGPIDRFLGRHGEMRQP